MLSMKVEPEPPSPLAADPAGEIIGSVAFIGEATGIIYLYAGMGFATVITSRLLGISVRDVDGGEMVTDAIGELSNMVAGCVKSRLCDRGWRCALTFPSVVRGQQLSVERPAHTTRRVIGFRNSQCHFLAEVALSENPIAKQL